MAVEKRVTISGLDIVFANLNREINQIQGRTKAGLREAALLIRRRAQQLAPHDTGHLEGSAYTEAYDTPLGPGAEIGFMALYAVFVHEIDRNYRKPGSQWKYLETAINENHQKILEVIKRRAQIPGR